MTLPGCEAAYVYGYDGIGRGVIMAPLGPVLTLYNLGSSIGGAVADELNAAFAAGAASRAEELETAFDAFGVRIVRKDGTVNWWKEVFDTREKAAESINISMRVASDTGHISTISPVKVRVIVLPAASQAAREGEGGG